LLADARTAAEAIMVDSCVITAPGSDPVFDENTGRYSSTGGATLYTGPCKRQSASRTFEQTAASGGRVFVEGRDQVHIPVGAPRIPAGSLVLVTAAPYEPHSVGVRLRVNGPQGKSLGTAQRLNVTEIVG
jgi:hypothetical protein